MLTKRLLLVATLFALCASGSYFLFKPNPQASADRALTQLQERNFAAAEETLGRLATQPMTFPIALYRGYLEQARGRFDESDRYFQSVLNHTGGKSSDAALIEALLAQASNAYFEERELSPLIDRASRLTGQSSVMTFFEGLRSYLTAEYGEALRAWNHFNAEATEGGSGWVESMVEHFFPLSWRQLHMAHCMTEQGDILKGRELLELESHQNSDLHPLATLLLGHTYLKESNHIPLDQRGSYYKLARFYFDRAGLHEQFNRERSLVSKDVSLAAEALLSSNLGPEYQKWGLDFVHTLQDWGAKERVNSLAQTLADRLIKERDTGLCQMIRKDFLGSSFHGTLSNRLIEGIALGLKEGQIEDIAELWSMVEAVSPSPRVAAKQIALLTANEIFQAVKRDTLSLGSTRQLLDFWDTLGQSTQQKERLAIGMMENAQLFWQNGGQEQKAARVMEMALKLTDEKEAMEDHLVAFLTSLYKQAENSNLIGRLSLIYDALEKFQVNKQELLSASKLANHLADAEYLYKVHNYGLAKSHANWVLKLDPTNDRALRLVGLSAFQLGEYQRAEELLARLGELDEHTHKALVLSQIFASQEQEKHLAQIDAAESFEDDE